MMSTFNNKLLAKAFWWFGLIVAIFAVVTEVYGKNIFLSSDFYFQLGIFSMLAAIGVHHTE